LGGSKIGKINVMNKIWDRKIKIFIVRFELIEGTDAIYAM